MRTGQAFTLTEVMVAATIAALVMAMASALLLNVLTTWKTNSAALDLSTQSRLLRERLLHGIQGEFGLRYAARGSILYTTNALQFRDSERSNRFTCVLQTNQPFRVQDATGATVFCTRANILLQSSAVTWVSNVLIMDLVLSIHDGRKTQTQSQQIKTYVSND